MEQATDTKTFSSEQYAPTVTPILDVLRPVPERTRKELSAGVYFFISSALILGLLELPGLQFLMDYTASSQSALTPWLAFGVIPVLGFLAAALAHQAGHLLAGRLAGFRPVGVALGRLRLGETTGRDLQQERVLAAGMFSMEPEKAPPGPEHLILLKAGGAIGNLFFALIMEGLRQLVTTNFLVSLGMHASSMFSLLLGVASLLPDVSATGRFSDGARILMLLKRNARADRWLAIMQLQQGRNRGESPRKWDEATVMRAVAVKDETHDCAMAHWLAYLWATDRQDVRSATKYLEGALTVLGSSHSLLRDRLLLEAGIFQAWYRSNVRKAEYWISQIKKGAMSELQRVRIAAAMLWAGNRPFEAWEKLGDYFIQLRKMPESPARDLAEKTALEWKSQMESRMLTRAWRTMYALSQEIDSSEEAVLARPQQS